MMLKELELKIPIDNPLMYVSKLAYVLEIPRQTELRAIEILKEAVAAEKDSIAFYLGMKDLVPERLGKEKIDVIIKEEMNHIKILGQKLIGLEKPKPGPSFG